MHRRSLTLAMLAGACGLGGPAVLTASSAADAPAMTRLAGSAAPMTSTNSGIAAVPGDETHTVQVWMAGDQAGAERYAQAVSTPGGPSYRQFLSPGAYSQRFGPTAAQVSAVESYLTGAGFSQVQASTNDDYVSATAPVSTIDEAFSVQMRQYKVTGADGRPTTIESNDQSLSVPTSLLPSILAITGLNTSQPQLSGGRVRRSAAAAPTASSSTAQTSACSQYWAQKTKAITPAFRGITKAALSICGYSADQVRAAYGQTNAATGDGKTIALIETGGPTAMFQTLTDYAKANELPVPRPAQYREEAIGQGDACGNPADSEEQIDAEAAYAMAPGANLLMVDGDSCDQRDNGFQSTFDAELAPLTGNGSSASAAIESGSYSFGPEQYQPASTVKTSHAIALRAASEGVSLLFSSGDGPGVIYPASDPDVTAVGGTTLGVGAQSQRVFETGWSDDVGYRSGDTGAWTDGGVPDASGGGAGDLYGEPSYQQGVVPAALATNDNGVAGRTVPDIAATADFASQMLFGKIDPDPSTGKPGPYTTFGGGGTSQSAPLVAGMIADAEQGQSNFGFINPLLYSLAGSSAYHDILPVRASDPQVDRAAYGDYSYFVPLPNGYKDVEGPAIGVFDAEHVSGPLGTSQVTARGYDTMTGLGTPNGTAFIDALRSGS